MESVGYIAHHTDLIPVGMGIGPFSLMTKLLSDPITPIYLAGSGVTADDDPDVKAVEAALELSLSVVLRSFSAQIASRRQGHLCRGTGGQRGLYLPTANRVRIQYIRSLRRTVQP